MANSRSKKSSKNSATTTPATPSPLTELSTQFEAATTSGRKTSVLAAVREVANKYPLEHILDALDKDDREFVLSQTLTSLVPASEPAQQVAQAPSASTPRKAGRPRKAKAEPSAPKTSKKRGKKAPTNRVNAAPKAAAPPKKKGKSGNITEAVAKIVGGLGKGAVFQAGMILGQIGDPNARPKVTAALNALIEQKKIARSGKGRASKYTVTA